jgi:hypothetical protein
MDMKDCMNRQLFTVARIGVINFAAALFFLGCAGSGSTAKRTSPAPANVHLEPAPQELGATTPKVVSVNGEQKFAVVDFGSQSVPEAGTLLNIYRGGKRVGAVRITQPIRAPLATADVVEGAARLGDDIH